MSHQQNMHDGLGVFEAIPAIGTTQAYGIAVPADASIGYAPGCIFQDIVNGRFYINEGTNLSSDFNRFFPTAFDMALLTASVAELNYLDADLASNILTRGTGVDTAESYVGAISRIGGLIHTRIVVDLSTLIGSATDLDIIGESAAANCNWGQITAAKSGTLIGGQVTCLEVPAGGATDIDFYSSNVATGVQDVIITDATLGTETALVTSGGAWASGTSKGMTALPTANDYLYIINGAASGGTFSAGKFLIEFYGV
jgi:hypothetical protein